MTRDILSLVFAILSGTTMVAQGTVTINGRVISDHHESAFYDLMIVNKRTRSGTFGNADGTFSVKALQTDTLLLGAIGHMTVSITMTDSVPRDSYRIEVVSYGEERPIAYGSGESNWSQNRRVELK